MKKIVGYSDEISVAPGDTIRFMVSCEDGSASYRADIVRVICGDVDSSHPGFKEEIIDTLISGGYPGRRQVIHAGSYAVVPNDPLLETLTSFSLQAWIWPTTPGKGRQTLLGKWSEEVKGGFALIVDDSGALALLLGDGKGGVDAIGSGKPLIAREWYFVAASYDAGTGNVWVYQEPVVAYPHVDMAATVQGTSSLGMPAESDVPFVLAAHYEGTVNGKTVVGGHYNGKIDSPRLANRAMTRAEMDTLKEPVVSSALATAVVAAWDFSRDISGDRITDLSANGLHGRTVNLPTRAMRGYNWTGEAMNWNDAPEQYGAIHFHDDDLDDAGWEVDFELIIPDDMRSGVYAARVRASGDEDHILFFVRPKRGSVTSKIVFLAPTATYMAYANNHTATDAWLREMARGSLIQLRADDLFLNEHREYGLATYDLHSDGSGACYSSRLRPILNMRPKAYLWNFNADTHITDWLEAKGYRFDVITDEDLHKQGVEALAPYRVVVTGTHPEYASIEMWDALKAYLDGGGRLMYLGGNGYYWRIAYHPDRPWVMEVRRAETGTRGWAAEPGEYYMSFTGEYGGLWRQQGRAPQMLVGVGYNAQGFDASTYYRRRPDSFNHRARFIFEGIGGDERIGDFGLVFGGAAGSEIDRHDRSLGTPPHALVVASSDGHSNAYYLAVEDVLELMPALNGYENDNVRADMVFFETPNGGGVFSTGSIAWAGALSHNGYDNNVSRITNNALQRFLDDEPF